MTRSSLIGLFINVFETIKQHLFVWLF